MDNFVKNWLIQSIKCDTETGVKDFVKFYTSYDGTIKEENKEEAIQFLETLSHDLVNIKAHLENI